MNERIAEILAGGGFSRQEGQEICALIERMEPEADWKRLCEVPLTRKNGQEDRDILAQLNALAEKTGTAPYALHLGYLANELPSLLAAYDSKGLDRDIFYGAVRDLRSKANECLECADCLGTMAAHFHMPFYRFERYALGRFQYERRINPEKDFSCGAVSVPQEAEIWGMHIPSGRPLTEDERLRSYRRAFDFYGCTKENPLIVHCGSWLLNPAHLEMLPPQSNICGFVRDFAILRTEARPLHPDAWRIFGKAAYLPVAQWPRDNSLKKAYAELLTNGGQMQNGCGLMIFDGDGVLTRDA